MRTLIPASLPVVILAARGFGRAEGAAVGPELGFPSLVRIKPAVTLAWPRSWGVLSRSPVPTRIAHGLHHVPDRKDARLTPQVVIRWRPGLPKNRDEPWDQKTALEGRAETLGPLSGRRRSVVELFRAPKRRGHGFTRRNTRLRKVERCDRLLLVRVLTSILRVGLGLPTWLDCDAWAWCTTRRAQECSVFTIGRAMLHRTDYLPAGLLLRVR